MATLIGLSLRVRLLRALPTHYKLGVLIRPGTHQSAGTINKQLSDKERVAAAVENKYLMGVIQGCLSTAGLRGIPALCIYLDVQVFEHFIPIHDRCCSDQKAARALLS